MERSNDRLRKFKRYPEYKDSGVEWLGEIPAHWEVNRLKHLCLISALYGANESAASYSHDGVRFLRTTDIAEDGTLNEDGAVYVDSALVSDYILREGDLLVSRSGTLGKSFVYNKKKHGQCAYAGYLVRFVLGNRLLPQFAFYFTKSENFARWLSLSVISSTIGNVNGQKYANIQLPRPSIGEQNSIATFLNRETARIDALIAKKERLIELLQEKRTALITHAVTKGLDPDIPMKDSGVEWLGEIPAHWRTKKLKFSVSFTGGGTPSKENPDYWKGDIPWVSPKDMKSEEVATTEDYITDAGLKESSTHLVQTACVLIVVRSGILKHTIPVAINQCEVALNQDMKALIPSSELNPSFLKLVILGNQNPFLEIWRKQGATVESIEHELLANTHVPLPPLIEQQHISACIDLESEGINHLLEQARVAIALLKEYRTALISAAVTGKIDVRDQV